MMAIRWDDFPHDEIRLKIYVRLRQNSLGRSAEDSLRSLLQRRLASLDSEDHRRFIELGAQNLVEHLRCTRDIYREFVEEHNCRPILEAHWVVLRCAVFPTAIEVLQKEIINYAKLTRIPGRDLSILFGIVTRTCRLEDSGGFGALCPPDLDDDTPATDDELQSFGRLINEDNLLWFRDIRDGGAVGRPFGGGPFSTDDAVTIHNSFGVCAIRQMTLPEWLDLRNKWWHVCTPWTDGLCNLFLSVQEELMSQWRALPPDSLVHELNLGDRNSSLRSIVVPSLKSTSHGERRKPGRKPRLAQEFVDYAGMLWRKASANKPSQVSDDGLQQIALGLDAAGYLPPSAHLEGKFAQELKTFNSRNSNSKIGPVKTWSQLISLGDKDNLRGMRRLLSRCARKLDDEHQSGN
jgi:hypothetical protein